MFHSLCHRVQFLVLSSSFFTLHLSPLRLKLILSPISLTDDTQLLHSCPPNQIHATVLAMRTCISDVKTLMTQYKRKLNDDKTEALLIQSNRTTFPHAQPTSLPAGSADIPFRTCARNLACFPTSTLNFKLLSFCLRGYQTNQLYPSVPDC